MTHWCGNKTGEKVCLVYNDTNYFNAAVTDRHTQLFLIIVNFTIFAAIEMYLASPQCYSWVWNNTDNISHTQLFFEDLAGRLLVCNYKNNWSLTSGKHLLSVSIYESTVNDSKPFSYLQKNLSTLSFLLKIAEYINMNMTLKLFSKLYLLCFA